MATGAATQVPLSPPGSRIRLSSPAALVYYYEARGVRRANSAGPRISPIERLPQSATATSFTRSHGSLLAVAVLALYPLLFLAQGIDFTDMGFNLSNQWLLLEDPGSYVHGHLFYLSNLLGGVWLAVSRPLGLLGAKLGWALIIYLTLFVSFRTLEQSGPRAGLLTGLVIALPWNTRIGTTWVSYNSLTALFFTLAAFFLLRGLTRDRPGALVAAGALLGAAPFVRFPNVLALALVAVIPLYAHLSRRTGRWALNACGRFMLGAAGGAAAVLLLMLALGHLPLYLDSLSARFAASVNDSSYDYSAGKLLEQLLQDYRQLLRVTAIALPVLLLGARALTHQWYWQLAGLAAVALLWYVWLGSPLLGPQWFIIELLLLIAALALMVRMRRGADESALSAVPWVCGTFVLIVLGYHFTRIQWAWLVPGCLYVALGLRYWRVTGAEDRLVTLVAAMILAITPLGSGNGMINAIFGMWLAIPLVFAFLLDEARAAAPRPWFRRVAIVVCTVGGASMLLTALDNARVAAYRDSSDRTRMTARIDDPFLRGVLTTPERALVVEELMGELPKHVAPGDPLLLHGDCALLHLLSRTRPVLGSSWTGVYNARMFNEKLLGFERSESPLPVVLLSKGSCRAREWPVRNGITRTGAQTRRDLMAFMARHGYRLLWQNAFFEIWSPAPGSRG